MQIIGLKEEIEIDLKAVKCGDMLIIKDDKEEVFHMLIIKDVDNAGYMGLLIEQHRATHFYYSLGRLLELEKYKVLGHIKEKDISLIYKGAKL